MNKVILILFLLFSYSAHASKTDKSCFIAKENNGKILKQEGDCDTSYTPQSTFKIALSLIGFDAGILLDKYNPSWSLPEDVDPYINTCKGDHNPREWMRDSCLWYSNILAKKLGDEPFEQYVKKLVYGNMDVSGGMTNASWVSSSLKISPREQITFIEKMIDHKFPISNKSYDKTKEIMFIEEMAGGWKLYGKTGSGNLKNKNGNMIDIQHGWFVGYIEKDKRQIIFASHLVDDKKQETFASLRAKSQTLIKLRYIIEELEK